MRGNGDVRARAPIRGNLCIIGEKLCLLRN